MFEVLFKIWWMIALLPLLIVIEGYKKLKQFMNKHDYSPDWAWTWLVILIVLLIILLLFQYGYH